MDRPDWATAFGDARRPTPPAAAAASAASAQLEAARAHLRAGDPARAMEAVLGCLSALGLREDGSAAAQRVREAIAAQPAAADALLAGLFGGLSLEASGRVAPPARDVDSGPAAMDADAGVGGGGAAAEAERRRLARRRRRLLHLH
jgi:hypothetical protein